MDEKMNEENELGILVADLLHIHAEIKDLQLFKIIDSLWPDLDAFEKGIAWAVIMLASPGQKPKAARNVLRRSAKLRSHNLQTESKKLYT